MSMLAEHYEFVIGGDPDRDTVDLAVLDTATGAMRAHRPIGRRRGLSADAGLGRQPRPGRRVWALEGTGSFAAGLAVFLAEAGEDVVEVGGGQATPAAPRTTGSTRSAPPGTRSPVSTRAKVRARGLREALRMILATRQAMLVSRTKAINELKSLIVVAPEHLRAGCGAARWPDSLHRIEAMRTQPAAAAVEHRMTVLTLQSIAARSGSCPHRSTNSTRS